MNKLEIKMNNTLGVLFFGMASFHEMARVWQLPGFRSVLTKIAEFSNLQGEITFAQYDQLAEMIEILLRMNPEKQPIFERTDILDYLVCMPNLVAIVAKLTDVVTKQTPNDTAENSGNEKTKK